MLISLLVHLLLEGVALDGLWLAGEWIPPDKVFGLVFTVAVILGFSGLIVPFVLLNTRIRLRKVTHTLTTLFIVHLLQIITCAIDALASIWTSREVVAVIALEEILINVCGLIVTACVWGRTKEILSKHPGMWKLSNANTNNMALICYIVDRLRIYPSPPPSASALDLERVEERITNIASKDTYETYKIRVATDDGYSIAWTTPELNLDHVARDSDGLFRWEGGVKTYLTYATSKEGIEKFVHDLSTAPLSIDLVKRFNMLALLSIGWGSLSTKNPRGTWI
jgi:hypothetical protein